MSFFTSPAPRPRMSLGPVEMAIPSGVRTVIDPRGVRWVSRRECS